MKHEECQNTNDLINDFFSNDPSKHIPTRVTDNSFFLIDQIC